MRCPRCRRQFDILQFVRLMTIAEYEDETVPVYKCPKREGGCGFLFALGESTIHGAMTGKEQPTP